MKETFLSLNNEDYLNKVEQYILHLPEIKFIDFSKNSSDLKELIENLIMHGRYHNTLFSNNILACKACYHRSITDIFRLVRYYMGSVSLTDVYIALLESVINRKATSWICADIGLRVYCPANVGYVTFNSTPIDEYNIVFPSDINQAANEAYGLINTESNLKKINIGL